MNSPALELLLARGAAELAHPGGTLAAHLQRVAARVARHGYGDDIQAAALCHAAYGTDGFDHRLLALHERPALRAMIGRRAEALVYEYASCDRRVVLPQAGADWIVFANRFTGARARLPATDLWWFFALTVANELDVLEHAPLAPPRRQAITDLLVRLGRHMSEEAWLDVRATINRAMSRGVVGVEALDDERS